MITEKELLHAVDTIQRYNRQIQEYLKLCLKVKPVKTDVLEWVELNRHRMEARLINGLRTAYQNGSIKYLEDINIVTFRRIRNLGNKSYYQFKQLTE